MTSPVWVSSIFTHAHPGGAAGEREGRGRRLRKEFMALAPQVPVCTEVEIYLLAEAKDVLDRLRAGEVRGAAVLRVADS